MIPFSYSLTPFESLRDEVDRLLEGVAGPRSIGEMPRAGRYPALNVWENEEAYFVEAECPGLKLDDIELYVTGNQLSISGKPSGANGNDRRYHRRERGVVGFRRVIGIPGDIDGDKVQASLKHGVLLVTLPKSEAAKPRKIAVNN